DGDALFEGLGGAVGCDAYWDADEDFYGGPRCPDLSTCLVPNVSDCDVARIAVTPSNAIKTNCGDELDYDCIGFVDALADQCGLEDCANGVDDNGDGQVDCADVTCEGAAACEACRVAYDFTVGDAPIGGGPGASGGWVSTGRDATGDVFPFQWSGP